MSAPGMQDAFLNQIRKDKMPCNVHLMNGFLLKSSIIVGFDNFVVLLLSEGERQMLVYKHAISSITPVRTVPWDHKKEV